MSTPVSQASGVRASDAERTLIQRLQRLDPRPLPGDAPTPVQDCMPWVLQRSRPAAELDGASPGGFEVPGVPSRRAGRRLALGEASDVGPALQACPTLHHRLVSAAIATAAAFPCWSLPIVEDEDSAA